VKYPRKRQEDPIIAAIGAGALVVAVIGLGFTGARNGRKSAENERAKVLQVLNIGRSALLADNGARACALLSSHGYRQALQFRLYYVIPGTSVPRSRRGVPRSCPEIVAFIWQDDHQPYVSPVWLPTLRSDHFRIRQISTTSAVVDLLAPGQAVGTRPAATISLARVDGEWKVDDANIVPVGD